MFKKIGLSAIAVLGMGAMALNHAQAAERGGVVAGRRAYSYPVYPAPWAEYPAPVVVDRPWVRHELRRDWDRDGSFDGDRHDRRDGDRYDGRDRDRHDRRERDHVAYRR